MNKKIGFIGAGNMGSAIIGGIIKNALCDKENVFVYDKNEKAVERLSKEYGTQKCSSSEACAKCDILFLCVKPNVLYAVIDEIKKKIDKNTVVVSIAAGQQIEKLEKAFSKDIYLIRVMPNTPALVSEGMSAVCFNKKVSENTEISEDVIKLLSAVGKTEIIDERLMDAVTGISGSSPAYVFMFIEALADAGVNAGMSRDKAYIFASQAVLGSAKMVLELNKHPGELKDMVCSPGGTTIEAVKVLEEKGFRGAIIDAVEECVKKSKSM